MKYPNSYLFIPAKYDLAKSYLRSGDKSAAISAFENIINYHKNTDYETGSYYYLGDLNSASNLTVATKYWKKYIEQSQDGRFSLDVFKEQIIFSLSLKKSVSFLIIG